VWAAAQIKLADPDYKRSRVAFITRRSTVQYAWLMRRFHLERKTANHRRLVGSKASPLFDVAG
jgi:hypothetical protein